MEEEEEDGENKKKTSESDPKIIGSGICMYTNLQAWLTLFFAFGRILRWQMPTHILARERLLEKITRTHTERERENWPTQKVLILIRKSVLFSPLLYIPIHRRFGKEAETKKHTHAIRFQSEFRSYSLCVQSTVCWERFRFTICFIMNSVGMKFSGTKGKAADPFLVKSINRIDSIYWARAPIAEHTYGTVVDRKKWMEMKKMAERIT